MTCDARGREVIRKREADSDGVPPGQLRLASPYDPDAASPVRPNLITDVGTTISTAPDVTATAGVQQRLTERQVKPGEHYMDSGYPSADLVTAAARQDITMITPLLADHSRQARTAEGFGKAAFRVDWNTRQAHCPEGSTSTGWYPVRQDGHDAIVVEFARSDCRPCPSRDKCTTAAKGRRMLTLRPQELHEAVTAARAEQCATSREFP